MKKFLSSLLLSLTVIVTASPVYATLPAGYTELEYIESTGTQYIDTGIIPTVNTNVKLKAQYTSFYTGSSSWNTVAGTCGNAINNRFYPLATTNGDDPKLRQTYGNNQYEQTRDTNIHVVDFNNANKQILVDGVNVGSTENGFTSASEQPSIYLFITNHKGQGLVWPAQARIYEYEVYESGVLVQKLIPAKNSSNVIGMYDTVSNAFFTNAGTGTFVAGPEIYNLFDKNADILTFTTRAHLLNIINNYNKPVLSRYGYQVNQDGSIIISNNRYSFITRANENIYNVYNGQIVDPVLSTQYITADGYPADQATGVYKISYAYNDELSESISKWATINDFMTNAMVVSGDSIPLTYIPYRGPEIKIATTAYNAAAFAPVEAALETAVDTIKDVVANTIVQADAIQNLQDTKQTMPDASGTNGTCPKFRQCLLIETASGTPQWFQIADPVHDLVLSLKNNKIDNSGVVQTTPNGGTFAANGYDGTNGTTDSRYFNGYPAMLLQTSAQSSPVSARQFSYTLLHDQNLGGQYKILDEQEWAVTWDGAETGTADSFLPGVIYGTSRCVKTSEAPTTTFATKVNPDTTGWTTVENSDALNDLENIEQYKSCFCKMTGVGLDGMITPVKNSSQAPWVFYDTLGSAGRCASHCATYCAYYVRGNASFRNSIMGWAVE